MTHRITPKVIEDLKNWITLLDEQEIESMPITSPVDGSPIHNLPLATGEDVAEAVRRARLAQERWSRLSVKARSKVFIKYHDILLDRSEEIMDLIQLETGKSRKDAFEEVADIVNLCRHYGTHADTMLRPRRRRGALPLLTRTYVQRIPIGVAGVISPSNYPLSMALSDSVPALIAGNAVVLKPAEQTSLTALWAVKRFEEAGLPLEVFQVVTGRGKDVGIPLVEQVDFIQFTGSIEAGRIVAKKASEHVIKYSLELGGKNPMLVLQDADLGKAVDGAVRGSFASAGQSCLAFERIYVHESLYDRFLELFAKKTRKLKIGHGFDFTYDVGSLISEDTLKKVKSHVEDAVKNGARVVTGGNTFPDAGPLFYQPTILTGVKENMEIFDEETFGPVVSVYPYRSLNVVVDKVNASKYGLSASVWTKDIALGLKLAGRLRVGTVNINDAYAAAYGSADAPMGGFKDSGIGRRHGIEGLFKYTEAQTVAVQRFFPLGAPRGMSEKTWAGVLKKILKLMSKIPLIR